MAKKVNQRQKIIQSIGKAKEIEREKEPFPSKKSLVNENSKFKDLAKKLNSLLTPVNKLKSKNINSKKFKKEKLKKKK